MFGSMVEDNRGRRESLRPELDHFVPHCYLARNPEANWIVACQLCNRYKSSAMFDSWEEACEYVWDAQVERGWVTIWRATVASTHDAEQWAREWARHLTHLAQFQRRGAFSDVQVGATEEGL